MDTLSTLLQGARLSARVTNTATLRAPWGLARGGGARAVFHVVSEGHCWLHVGGESWAMAPGSAVLLPRGDAHALTDAPDTAPSPLQLCAAVDEMPAPDVIVEGGGARCRLVCGVVALGGPVAEALLDALPTALVIPPGPDGALGELLGMIAREAEATGPASRAILDGLARLLFLYALRQAVDDASEGLLGALSHSGLRRALKAMHERPGADWDLPALASVAGMSRSSFAAAFSATVGHTPAAYLRGLRLELAAARLASEDPGLERLAEEAGYSSGAAFSRAFKAHHGLSPRAWRRQRHREQTQGAEAEA